MAKKLKYGETIESLLDCYKDSLSRAVTAGAIGKSTIEIKIHAYCVPKRTEEDMRKWQEQFHDAIENAVKNFNDIELRDTTVKIKNSH